MIRLYLLGPTDIRLEDGTEARTILAQPKRLALLSYLAACSPLGPKRRDTLLGLFWPELDQEHARNALSKSVHFLRRALGEGAIVSRSPDELALGEMFVWNDVRAFTAALDGKRHEEALALYRGDLLQSFFVSEAAGFDSWLERERALLRSRAAGAARALAEQHERTHHLTQAIECARRAVDLSEEDERPLRRLIELLARLGDRSGAIRAYEVFARRLATELEIEPSHDTMMLVEQIRQSRPEPKAAPARLPLPAEPVGSTLDRLGSALAGRYKVERQLGAGAMAVVALAHDLRHHRRVAIKVLRPELSSLVGSERFLREIDIVASLMHPHILPLHDSGETDGLLYYVMPYVEGESLRGRMEREKRLPVQEALQIGREVADALAYAHHRGFIHRDIKPENILLGGGHALVADFGIARALAGADQLTAVGFATGTPSYMSPEQLTGDSPVDERSDIYALGCVVYEMLTGGPPWAGNTPEAVIARRLSEPPPRASAVTPEISPELEQVISRALAIRADDRFPTAADFGASLSLQAAVKVVPRVSGTTNWLPATAAATLLLAATWFAGSSVKPNPEPASAKTPSPNIAVLPFRNLGDSSDAYLVEGLTQELNKALIDVGPVTIRPSAAVSAAVATGGDLREVANLLDAAYVVDGTARRIGKRLRVNLELVSVKDGAATWSQAYDITENQIPALPESLAIDVATALSAPVRTRSQHSRAGPTDTDPATYDLYLQAKHFTNLQSVESVQRGASLFARAIGRDSGFGQAWTGLAAAYDWLSQFGGEPSDEIQRRWSQAIQYAISLDSLNAEAYIQRGSLRTRFEWNFAGAGLDLRRAIALSPGLADAHLNYSQFLNVVGLHDSALAVMRHAVAINPTVPFRVVNLVPRLRMAGHLKEAAAEARHALSLDSTLWIAHLMLAAVLDDQGKPAEAAAEAAHAQQIAGDLPFLLGTVARYHGRAGRRNDAVAALVKLVELGRRQYVQRVFVAEARLGVGDRAGALDALEESARIRDSDLTWKLAYGHFSELREEPRYAALMARIGLANPATYP
jgi:serine/threonine-protein kinase